MTEGNFVDYVKVNIQSGNGGKGSSHFRREKYIVKGGPDGGDGGRGGHIIILGNKSLWTLYHFKHKRHFKSEHGGDGSRNRSSGTDGKDLFIEVPIGTIVRNSETNEIICESLNHDEEHIVLEGGLGGKGNWNFKSPTNQAPRYSQPGLRGKELQITIELKVLADVGLVGFPNAGKSTLLKTMTSAKPKIGDYEFTTLKPNLGIVEYRDYKSFVMADIPGIIEGASKGKGLGHYFLRHIERNSLLLFMVSSQYDVIERFHILLRELEEYNPELIDKDIILAISKSDLINENEIEKISIKLKNKIKNIPFVFISSVSNRGIMKLKDIIWKVLNT